MSVCNRRFYKSKIVMKHTHTHQNCVITKNVKIFFSRNYHQNCSAKRHYRLNIHCVTAVFFVIENYRGTNRTEKKREKKRKETVIK